MPPVVGPVVQLDCGWSTSYGSFVKVVDKGLTKELLSIGCWSSGSGVLGCGSRERQNVPLIIQIYLLSPGLWLHGQQGDAWVENELVPQWCKVWMRQPWILGMVLDCSSQCCN